MTSADDPDRKLHFDIVVADGFVLAEVAAVVDLIRIANRISARELFSWTYRSRRGGKIHSFSEAYVDSETIPEQPEADYVFVIGNSDPDCPDLSLGREIDGYTFRRAQVFLLAEAASRYIHERGLGDDGLTTHWENSVLLRERHGVFEAGEVIASKAGSVVTCAGMGSTFDVVLAILGRHVPSAIQSTVADVMLHERMRAFDAPQHRSDATRTRTGDRELDLCLDLMRANVDEPLPISELGRLLGISNRSLERRFKTFLGSTPNGYYRQLRLNHANNLLQNTNMSVRDVGLACGFASGFSSLYREAFGMTPTELRKRRQITQP